MTQLGILSPIERCRSFPGLKCVLSWETRTHYLLGLLEKGRMVVSELSGARVFALHVHDDSMEPLFPEGEIIFVNPDFELQPGHYGIFLDQTGGADPGCLRQFKKIQERYVVHSLNIQYKDTPLTSHQKVIGRVIRLRMKL